MKRAQALTIGLSIAVMVAGCGRSDEQIKETASTAPIGTAPPETVGLAQGGFGDLGVICSGTPEGMELVEGNDPGVTAESIQVSTVSDPGFPGRPGLNQELFDTAEAFTSWCNEHGGINGRKIELKLRDAMLTQFQQRVIEACDEGDFAMVGGGAVFDDTGQVERLDCELPAIPGYAVTAKASAADLTVQPVPNPSDTLPIGDFLYLAETFPESTQNVAVLTGDLATTVTVANRYKEGIAQLDWKVVYDEEYPSLGVDSWRPFAESIKANDAKGLIWVGEPVNLAKLMSELKALDVTLDWVRTDANHYDAKVLEAGDDADGVYVRSAFAPFIGNAAEAGSATAQYADLIETYDEGGIQAYLGIQSLSAWLLFATAARDCGAELTRDCLMEKAAANTTWSGGGIHAPLDLSGATPSTCYALFVVEGGAFATVDIAPNNGIYRCDPDNVATLVGDYGTGAKCQNSAFATDPKPSNCGSL